MNKVYVKYLYAWKSCMSEYRYFALSVIITNDWAEINLICLCSTVLLNMYLHVYLSIAFHLNDKWIHISNADKTNVQLISIDHEFIHEKKILVNPHDDLNVHSKLSLTKQTFRINLRKSLLENSSHVIRFGQL